MFPEENSSLNEINLLIDLFLNIFCLLLRSHEYKAIFSAKMTFVSRIAVDIEQ